MSTTLAPAPAAVVELETVIGKHLWLIASRRCSCQSRPIEVGRHGHYAWYMRHLADVLISEGYSKEAAAL